MTTGGGTGPLLPHLVHLLLRARSFPRVLALDATGGLGVAGHGTRDLWPRVLLHPGEWAWQEKDQHQGRFLFVWLVVGRLDGAEGGVSSV